jgi:tetratricopeptide (TPR) repeat protein
MSAQGNLTILVAAAALLSLVPNGASKAEGFKEQVCDTAADSALGLENYQAAIAFHRRFLHSHPDNALAHYHLGFAYGMTGRSSEEISEYQRAANLGLRDWDLFLDLGLAYFEQRDYTNAIQTLETSAALGSDRPETHFNLALAYEKAGRLADSMKQILISLRLAPADLDMRNTKAIICAEAGDPKCAHDEWMLLLKMAPSYSAARTNLAILLGAAPQSSLSLGNAREIPQLVTVERASNDKRIVISVRHAPVCWQPACP